MSRAVVPHPSCQVVSQVQTRTTTDGCGRADKSQQHQDADLQTTALEEKRTTGESGPLPLVDITCGITCSSESCSTSMSGIIIVRH